MYKVVVATHKDLAELPDCWKQFEVVCLPHCPPGYIFFVNQSTAEEWAEWEESMR